ncbi:IQ motif, EF-hand binding site [Artemisia annua]|uniref:IQ motif, EF-hand binding site n=1 Tax=Artemisia annua TaxID=35608 RepID=A0A2U1NBP3_ARTAN|nr:IQ motif, EF-hand binding site [Artemisia annua]
MAKGPHNQQLQSLLETLSHTEPHYVRCVKPNSLLKPDIFENQNILQQLRCGGVMEAIRISTTGFPTRKPYHEFVERFKILALDIRSTNDIKCSKMLLEKAGQKGYQIGKTKVFVRAGQMAELDPYRNEVLGRSATKIRAKYLSHSNNKKFILLRRSTMPTQTIVRAMKTYGALYCSIIRMQASIRGMAASNIQINRKLAGAPLMAQARNSAPELDVKVVICDVNLGETQIESGSDYHLK